MKSETESKSDINVVENAVCLACGCLCDDIRITSNNDRVLESEFACETGADWLRRDLQSLHATSDGQPVGLEVALDRAIDILRAAKRPLVYGLTATANESVRASLEFADRRGALFDLSLSQTQRGCIAALTTTGKLTATFGEARNAGRLAVFFCCDPATTHPRFFERFHRQGTPIVVIDTIETETSRNAAQFIQIPPDSGYEALSAIRATARGLNTESFESPTGVSANAWTELDAQMHAAQVVSFFHAALHADHGREDSQLLAEALYGVARDMSDRMRVFVIALGDGGNATGAVEAVTWQTGFPPPIDFSAGFPQHCSVTLSADTQLSRKAVDAALIIEPSSTITKILSTEALDHLNQIPTIVLSSTAIAGCRADVDIRVAALGIEAAGTVHRADNVALPVRAVINSERPDTAELVALISERLFDEVTQ